MQLALCDEWYRVFILEKRVGLSVVVGAVYALGKTSLLFFCCLHFIKDQDTHSHDLYHELPNEQTNKLSIYSHGVTVENKCRHEWQSNINDDSIIFGNYCISMDEYSYFPQSICHST